MTQGLYKRRRRFGKLMTLYKLFMMLFCTGRLILRLPAAMFADTIIIHREVFPLGKPWFESLLIKLSRHSLFDLDDAIWLPPSNGINQRSLLWDQERIPKIMRTVDVVIAGNSFIAKYAKSWARDVEIIPTGYDNLLTCQHETPIQQHKFSQEDGVTRIVWIGNWGNAGYVEAIIPALESAFSAVPFRLVLIGAQDIFDIESSIIDIEYHLWSREKEHSLLPRCDIGIMPLTDEAYEQGKCAFKLIQYMSSQLALIGTPIGMNREVITAETGIQAHSLSDWENAVIQLCENKIEREVMAEAAYASYQNQFSREIIFRHLLAHVSDEMKLQQGASV